jgi:hypothetical protein
LAFSPLVADEPARHCGDMTDQQLSPTAQDGAPWDLPDSEICSAATALVFKVSEPFIVNHCIRSYLFGREIAAAKGLRSGVDYNDDDLFLACMLHDLGVSDYANGGQRFEVDGADAAARFLRERGFGDDRITPVWQSIALHTSVGLADRFGALPALSHFAISLDINGLEKDLLPTGFADRVFAAWPRHNLGYAIASAIARDTAANPMKAPPFSFPAHLHELVNGVPGPSFFDVVGWGDSR